MNELVAEPLSRAAGLFAADYAMLLQPDMMLRLVVLALLFVASAFFSGSETALFSLSRMQLHQLRRERNPQSEKLHALLDQPRRLIISILCGNEFVNVAAAANLTGILVRLYGVEQAAWASTVLMVPLLLLFGEATPKTIAVSDPVGISTRLVAQPMYGWVRLITPLALAVRLVADRITTAIVGEERAQENLLQIDEFRTLVDEGVVTGELTATERVLIDNLLLAGNAEIVEIMIPRTRMICIDADQPVDKIIQNFLRIRHRRVPVYRGNRDNVIGFLYAEDALQLALDHPDLTDLRLEEVLRPPVMVPSTKKIDEMFDYFQVHDVRAAVVLNEFGGVDGLLTMNDVLTCIFGRVRPLTGDPDVHYDEASGEYLLPGYMKLFEFNALASTRVEDLRMTTLAGVILRELDRLPKVGDVVTVNGTSFEVLEMDNNRVARVLARLEAPPSDAQPTAPPPVEGQAGGGADDGVDRSNQ
jgi:CBS domain containing-hemolysin-like protein